MRLTELPKPRRPRRCSDLDAEEEALLAEEFGDRTAARCRRDRRPIR
jgi:hypothetical protein